MNLIKLIFLFLTGLFSAWLSLNSLLFAVAHWSHDGALMPALASFLGLLLSFRLLLGLVRIYLPPKNRRRGYLD